MLSPCRLIRAEGPVLRRVWYFSPDGDGHATLDELVQHCLFHDKPIDRDVQPSVEYVEPWAVLLAADDVPECDSPSTSPNSPFGI